MSNIGVVIVNWNGSDDTIACVNSLRHIHSNVISIVVVDNGSIDKEIQKLQILKEVKLVYNDSNLGFASATNQGLQLFLNQCNPPDYLLLLNNDTYCIDDFLHSMVNCMESDKLIGSISPLIMYADKKIGVWFQGGLINKRSGEISNFFNNLPASDKKPFYEVDWSNGCCFLVRTSVIKKIGLLNETFKMYVEDVELSLRIRLHGFRNYLDANAVLYHKVSASSGGYYSDKKRFYISRNTILISRMYPKYFGLRFSVINIIKQLARCVYFPGFKKINALVVTLFGTVAGLIKKID